MAPTRLRSTRPPWWLGGLASTVQVLVYRRGLRRRDATTTPPAIATTNSGRSQSSGKDRAAFDPRLLALAALAAFVALLRPLHLMVAAGDGRSCWRWRGSTKPDREPLATGLVFAAILAGGALIFSLGGGLGLDVALRRASRAALLVLTATWLRGAAGAEGLREVARRVLGRLRWLPAMPEAAAVLDEIPSEGRLAAPGRGLLGRLDGVPRRRAAARRRARLGGGRIGRGQAGTRAR